jgi:hypothetical protein
VEIFQFFLLKWRDEKMRQRKFKFLLVALLVVSGLLFAGGEARAITFTYNVTIDPNTGVKSTDVCASSTYTYNFTRTGDTSASYVDFEIPVDIFVPPGSYSGGGNTTYFNVTGSGVTISSVDVYDKGIGDFGTKFGVGDTRYRVMKVNFVNPSQSFTVILALKGQNLCSAGKQFADFLNSEQGLVLLKAGNGSNTYSTVVTTPTVVATPPTPPSAPTVSISAPPGTIPYGGCASLTWGVTGTYTSAAISNYGPVTASTPNPLPVCNLIANTTFQITATGPGGSATPASAFVTVGAQPTPPVISFFSAYPNPVLSGKPLTLTWNTVPATGTAVKINNTPVPTDCTSYTVTPANLTGDTITVSFKIEVTVTGAPTSSQTIYVDVAPIPPKPLATISTDCAVITPPQCATLSWSSTGAISANLDPIGPVAPSSPGLQVCPANTTTYVLTVTNSVGDSTTLTGLEIFVNAPSPLADPIVTHTIFELPNPLYPDVTSDPKDRFITFRYVRGQNNCIVQVEKYNDLNGLFESIPWQPATFGGKNLLSCAMADRMGRCDDCMIELAGTPHSVYTSTNGQAAQLTNTCITPGELKIYNNGVTPLVSPITVTDCYHSADPSAKCDLCYPNKYCGERCCSGFLPSPYTSAQKSAYLATCTFITRSNTPDCICRTPSPPGSGCP